MLLEKIVVEGIMPERALAKLQKAGICVFHVKKLKKNQILLSVNKKDAEKVFAIYPNVCYNISVYSPYTARRVGAERRLALLENLGRRPGLVVGALLFAAVTLACNRFVLRIDVTGSDSYRTEVLDVLERHGVKTFGKYPTGAEGEIASEILALDGVSYCSVRKTGMAVRVEVRLSAFSEPTAREGDMSAEHDGEILSMAVLRGTPEKKVGDRVVRGDTLVGGYSLSESGEKTPVLVIARVTISCLYEDFVEASDEREAFARAYLAIGADEGSTLERSAEKTENGYLVKISYTATESFNF